MHKRQRGPSLLPFMESSRMRQDTYSNCRCCGMLIVQYVSCFAVVCCSIAVAPEKVAIDFAPGGGCILYLSPSLPCFDAPIAIAGRRSLRYALPGNWPARIECYLFPINHHFCPANLQTSCNLYSPLTPLQSCSPSERVLPWHCHISVQLLPCLKNFPPAHHNFLALFLIELPGILFASLSLSSLMYSTLILGVLLSYKGSWQSGKSRTWNRTLAT